MPRAIIDYPNAFWARVDFDGSIPSHRPELGKCWLWTLYCIPDGYGLIQGRMAEVLDRLAHRAAWILAFDEIAEGLSVCHHCDNPPCCRPSHLFLGTQADNNRDAAQKGRTRTAPQFGKQNPRGSKKLSEDQVRAIRQARENGQTKPDIASDFGVSLRCIEKILYGQTWAWLK
jgi:hypothetical protein